VLRSKTKSGEKTLKKRRNFCFLKKKMFCVETNDAVGEKGRALLGVA
jgi:hypothetical protein